MFKKKNGTPLFILFAFVLASCASKKKVLYIQDVDLKNNREISYNFNTVQVNDLLDVNISSLYPEAAIPYNFKNNISSNSNDIETIKLRGNLVSKEGTVKLPVIGAVKASGKSIMELESHIKSILEKGNYLKDAIVSIRILNSKITILGEVNQPGTYTITEQNISVFQALGYAGDLTIHADRKDIIVIREHNGKQLIKHIDLTKTDWFEGNFYFLQQNDVLVVNPNNTKVKSSGLIGNMNTFLSLTSILLTSIILFVK